MLKKIRIVTRKLLPYVGIMALSIGMGCSKRPKSFGVYESDGTTSLLEAEYTIGCIKGFDMNYQRTVGGKCCVEGIDSKLIEQAARMLPINKPEFLVYLADSASIKNFEIYGIMEGDRACFDNVSGKIGRQCSDFYYNGRKKITHSTKPEGDGLFSLHADSLTKEIGKSDDKNLESRLQFFRDMHSYPDVYAIFNKPENKVYLFRTQ